MTLSSITWPQVASASRNRRDSAAGDSNGAPLWMVPHLLSLDAPAVAVVWQALLAQHLGFRLDFGVRAVLGFTVWFIYIADRLLDVRGEQQVPRTARHRFYLAHWRLSAALLTLIGITDVLLAAFYLPPLVWVAGAALAASVLAYMGAVHLYGMPHLPKAILVAILFAGGTFLAPVACATPTLSSIWLPAATFFGLCVLNLVLIDAWEAEESDASGSFCPGPSRLRLWLPLWVALLAPAFLPAGNEPWFRAIAMSAAAMLALLLSGRHLNADMRRVLVDVALLAPAVFFLS